MDNLKGFQRSYLSKKAHSLKPVVMIGGNGLTDAVIKAVDAELENHEMIKVKFVDHKEARREIAEELAEKTDAQLVRVIGNIAVLYRYQTEHDKRIYHVPKG
ncbi:MAG: ribosome assembly RNA-binding protein YhbY [Spirochaetales bacterium]|nr:ribosome assembly RNA-binding protein YhbY [Spirochaetales bacterium]